MKSFVSSRSGFTRDFKYPEKTEMTKYQDTLLNGISELYYVLDKHSVISMTDLQGNITYANNKFSEISGYTNAELIGSNHNILKSGYHPHSFFKDLWATIISGKIWQGEIKNKSKDGKLYWVDTTISPIFDDEHKITGFLSFRNVITKTKEEAERLQTALTHEKELNEMKNKFVSIVSHELKSPLTAIHTSAEILEIRRNNNGDLEFRKNCGVHITNIKEQISRLTELIDDILSLTRVESGKVSYKPEKLYLKKYLEEFLSCEEIRNLDERGIKFRFSGNENPVFADKELLEHTFLNIISNSFKYSSGKPPPALVLNFRKEYAEVKFRDYGIGIPSDEIENLFEPFYRASNSKDFRGTGIGLALVKEFLDLHNAHYSIKSKFNKGTVFTIYFKYSE